HSWGVKPNDHPMSFPRNVFLKGFSRSLTLPSTNIIGPLDWRLPPSRRPRPRLYESSASESPGTEMSLRILQVDSGRHPWDGTLRHLADLSTALAGRGHAVSMACPEQSIQAQYAADHGFPTINLELRSDRDWSPLPGFIRAVAGKYDVVHVHSPLD